MKRVFLLLGLSLPAFILWKCVDQYVLCPTYNFAEPKPFHGNVIVNPYANTNLTDVSVANFHAHTKFWSGLTNGKGMPADLYRRYDSLGHEFHAVSQYHHIDTFGSRQSNYVPAYEHGYNIKKTHQLVIGARQILWKDFIFPQTIHNKQEVLVNLAKDSGNIVVLNHPAIRDGYTTADLKKLHYYDYIELLNPSAQSIKHWDTILSAGKRIYAMGNDDIHNVFNNDAIGRFVTFVYGAEGHTDGMMKSLKQGATAAVWLPQIPSQQLMEKRERLEAIQQVLNSVIVRNNQLEIRLNDVVDEIRLVSDRGEIKKVVQSTSELTAELLPKESYWRAELLLKDGTRIFLNPLLRQTDEKLIARNEVAALIVSRNPGEPTLALVLGIFVMVLGSTGKHLPKANTTGGKYAWLRQPPLTN
ncbi:MAG: hypothetical protein RLY85_1723 [Bacteroidota bacterium]|jgi:hypothetical protein